MRIRSKMTLPEWMRRRLSDGQRFLALCVMAGLLCGLAAVAFHLAIHSLFHWLWETARGRNEFLFITIMISAPTLAGLVVGIGVRYFPKTSGSGIPQTKEAYYNAGGQISSVTGFWRFVLGALYVGLGNSLGREGPTVHICTAISSRIGRWAFRDASRVQAMAPVGMAAGIAAAFNAPLSALTFVFEELLDNFSMKAMGGMVVAVVIAAAVSRSILGEDPVITARIAEDYVTSWWMLVCLPLGILAGLLGHFFVRGILNLRFWFRERCPLPAWVRPASGGLCCGILGIGAWYLTGMMAGHDKGQGASNSVFSIGYESLEATFENHLSAQVIVVLLVLKLVAVLLNYASGGSGGLFSPTLFLGGMLGSLCGMGLAAVAHLGDWIPMFPANDAKVIGGCVLLGMGAMFAAVIRCPITSLIIIFEMTGNYSLILPLMAGNMIAWRIAGRLQPVSIYNALLLQDGIPLRQMPGYRGNRDYRKLPVQAIMTHEPFAVTSTMTVSEALQAIARKDKRYHGYPVLDEEGHLTAVITHRQIAANPHESILGGLVSRKELVTVTPDTPIRKAANLMISRDIRQVPVVSAADSRKLLGWLTLNDIARQQNAADE